MAAASTHCNSQWGRSLSNDAARKARAQRRVRLAPLGKLLSEPEGRAWLYDILTGCNVFGATLTPDALGLAYNEGRRSLGVQIMRDALDANFDGFHLMLKEELDERRAATERRDDRSGYGEPFADARDDDEC